ncbi:bifunctional (p)ppGpp synthetase/guanosine-3',5'-bis(diphosphate) 3'-pyrophosphohydrolase [Flavobacterium psychrophilum]
METKAMIFAIEAHASTNHTYDNKPYSIHLTMVANIARKYIDIIPDQCQDEVLSACWLHDTIEDCRLTYNDIKKEFGENVAEIVYAVTNDKGKNRSERAGNKYYDGIRRTTWATFVKLCDRLANIKYSSETKSRMLQVYKKEQEKFIDCLLPLSQNKGQYTKLIEEMNSLLAVTKV